MEHAPSIRPHRATRFLVSKQAALFPQVRRHNSHTLQGPPPNMLDARLIALLGLLAVLFPRGLGRRMETTSVKGAMEMKDMVRDVVYADQGAACNACCCGAAECTCPPEEPAVRLHENCCAGPCMGGYCFTPGTTCVADQLACNTEADADGDGDASPTPGAPFTQPVSGPD